MRKLVQNSVALGLMGIALFGQACQESGQTTKRTITFSDDNKYSGSLDSEGKEPASDETTIPSKGGGAKVPDDKDNGDDAVSNDGKEPVVETPADPMVPPPVVTPPVTSQPPQNPVTPEPPKTEVPPNPAQVLANGVYRIQGVGSRLCLQPRDKSKSMNAETVQFACNMETAQRFQLTFTGDKYYQITNVNSTLSLQIIDGVVVNQAKVVQGSYTNSAHQHFVIEKSATAGVFHIKPRLNNALCLDVSYASLSDNAFIQLWNECHLANQQWVILPVN